LIDEDAFLEWAEVHGNLYGTRRKNVEEILESGRDVILDVDVQGALNLRQRSPDAVLIFLVPPSVATLERRLRGRAQDSDEVIATRLRNARQELRHTDRFDYLVLNEDLETAIAEIQAIITAERCRSSRRSLKGLPADPKNKAAHDAPHFAPKVVYASRKMAELLGRAERVARSDTPVLLMGESGTGKEIIAESIHRASPRNGGPLLRVNCGAIPSTLLESELFGHVAGAFTGAVRDKPGLFRTAVNGTIVLDEIGEVPLDLQVKLLRVLQDGEVRPVGGTDPQHVDVRVIAATNRDLPALVGDGRFREDLFYRLNVVALQVPPLRARREDIPVLIDYFLKRLAGRGMVKTLDPEAAARLAEYEWPGNVRQLENAIEHAVVLSKDSTIRLDDFPQSLRAEAPGLPAVEPSTDHRQNLMDVEIATIQSALTRTNNNLTHAARILGITRRALSYRLDKYGLDVKRRRGRPRRA
jgi:two-component system response regulator AtoC